MPLVPYEPIPNLLDMRRELERFLSTSDLSSLRKDLANPSIDIYEREKEVVARCDLPGLEKKEDINIEIDDNLLTISGAINRLNEEKDEQIHRQERFYGRFQRSISLPSRVSTEGVKATYKNGVLEIRMPKVQSNTQKRINIDFH